MWRHTHILKIDTCHILHISQHVLINYVRDFFNRCLYISNASRSARPVPTTTTQENIESVERIVMGDRQISVRWVPKFLTPLQRVNRVECCLELLHNDESNPSNFSAVSLLEVSRGWVHYYDPLSKLGSNIWKKQEERTPAQPKEHRSVGKETVCCSLMM